MQENNSKHQEDQEERIQMLKNQLEEETQINKNWNEQNLKNLK